MKMIKHPSVDEVKSDFTRENILNQDFQDRISPIFDRISKEGDKGLLTYTALFDKIEMTKIEVERSEIERLAETVQGSLNAAIHLAAANIEAFHNTQHRYEAHFETMPGITLLRKDLPIQKVGLYVENNTGPEISGVLSLGVPARLASCQEIILCVPPQRGGTLHPATAAAVIAAGIHRVFLVSGAQAIAAMATGTESVPKVDKIFGKGDSYVAAAKKYASGLGVAIDMPAGRPELMIITDDNAPLDYIAADILGQAEANENAIIKLVTTSPRIFAELDSEIERQASLLLKSKTIPKVLENSSGFLVKNIEEAIQYCNDFGPQQLILAIQDPEYVARSIQHAGTIFLGFNSPQSLAKLGGGANEHVPTNGFSRAYSGVSLDSFIRKITLQKASENGLEQIAKAAEVLAQAEGRYAQARTITQRRQKN